MLSRTRPAARQWCALVWYIASYIPFGQKIITKILGRAIGD